MTGAVATHLQNKGSKKPFHMAMLIPMVGFILAWVYPLYVNFFNKETMDVHRATDVGIVVPSEKELALEEQASHPEHKDHVSTL
jgi:FHS family L-fucose permease-like MFS transporter